MFPHFPTTNMKKSSRNLYSSSESLQYVAALVTAAGPRILELYRGSGSAALALRVFTPPGDLNNVGLNGFIHTLPSLQYGLHDCGFLLAFSFLSAFLRVCCRRFSLPALRGPAHVGASEVQFSNMGESPWHSVRITNIFIPFPEPCNCPTPLCE